MSQQILATASAALFGFTLMMLAGAWLMRRWDGFTPLQRLLFGGGLALFELAFWLGVYGFFIEPSRVVTREISVVSDTWRGAPLRVAVLADLDVTGPHVTASRVEDVVGRVSALHPDIVVLLGNLVDGPPSSQRSAHEREQIARTYTAIALLNAPMGIVAVLGPDDLHYGAENSMRSLEDAGVAVLSNRAVAMAREGGDVVVAGASADSPNIGAALDGAPPLNTIAIANSAADVQGAESHAALVLSGCREAPCGRRGETGYASAGIGGRLFRVLAPPEITLVTLRGRGVSATNN